MQDEQVPGPHSSPEPLLSPSAPAAEAAPASLRSDHDIGRDYLARLAERTAATPWIPHSVRLAELNRQTLAYLTDVIYLGGYTPAADLDAGESYDVRFLADRLAVLTYHTPDLLTEIRYTDIETVDIGGPGLVKSGGGFIGGGFGLGGVLEGMAVAAVLNALTTKYTVRTIIRVQAESCELFLLETQTTPEDLRILLSRPLSAIRKARPVQERTTGSPARSELPQPAAVIDELTKLASLHERGLLTREEFDRLKAKLIAST